MLRMPVATLRVWERRYRLTEPALSPSGQRLYAASDVQRLAVIKQLTDLGHAIGSLAPLDMQQLQRVAATHAQALAVRRDGGLAAALLSATAEPLALAAPTSAASASRASRSASASAPAPAPAAASPAQRRPPAVPVPAAAPGACRLAVIGAALGRRLQRPALQQRLRRLGRVLVLLGPFDDIAQAAQLLGESDADALLIQAPQLHDGWLPALHAAAPRLAGLPTAVVYAYATEPVCDALAAVGTALLREPQPDAALLPWLQAFVLSCAARTASAAQMSAAAATGAVPPRRWDDAALADFAGLSSTVACECPRHVAELLVQLSQFEAYSAECQSRSKADAALHAYLRHVAAVSRANFEAALEHVALHEGLMLPPEPSPAAASTTSTASTTTAAPRARSGRPAQR